MNNRIRIIVSVLTFTFAFTLTSMHFVKKDLHEIKAEVEVVKAEVLKCQIQIEDLQESYDILYEEIQELKLTSSTDVFDNTIQRNRWGIKLTEEEIELLAQIVYLEAGNQSDWGIDAVVEVIFNRIYDEDFPNTLEDVLSQDKQFSTWKNRHSAVPIDAVYESIHYVLSGKTDVLPFETVYFSRGGESGKEEQITIGDHIFCNK